MPNLVEVDKNLKYYKITQLNTQYRNGKQFNENVVAVSEKEVNLDAKDNTEIGGFCISDYKHIFRWVIRGNYLCEVQIPDDTKIYKAESENGIYVSNKIILVNPIKMSDEVAMKLYLSSELPEISYIRAMAACCIQGYVKTAEKVFQDKINKNNCELAFFEFESFCKRREEEYKIKVFEIEHIKLFLNKIKNYDNH